jgi:hypothetical protein
MAQPLRSALNRTMLFTAPAEHYDRFMGRYAPTLATALADLAGVASGMRVFWEPFTLAVGPAGHYLASLPAEQRMRVREACPSLLPDGPFALEARAWCARGTVPRR